MGKSSVTFRRDDPVADGVLIALSRARAAATLAYVCTCGDDYLQVPTMEPAANKEIRTWIQAFAFEQLESEIAAAADAYRKSLSGQAHMKESA